MEPPASPEIEFEWSDVKAAANLRNHGVSFDEAETAFEDDLALIIPDEWHSDDEPREILIGYSVRRRLLFIAFIRRAVSRVRIIHARRADRLERIKYEEEQSA